MAGRAMSTPVHVYLAVLVALCLPPTTNAGLLMMAPSTYDENICKTNLFSLKTVLFTLFILHRSACLVINVL